MTEKTRRTGIASILEGYSTEYQKRIGQSWTTLEDLNNIADKCFELLMPLQWIDGPPENTREGRYVLVVSFPVGADDEYEMVVNLKNVNWDRLIHNFGPIIKHMRLPEYE